MLHRSRRLSAGQFAQVVKKGRIIHSPLFYLRVLAIDEATDPITRIAMVMPQKIARTAVMRNKMRRQMYAALRDFLPTVKSGYWVTVFGKELAPQAAFKDLVEGLRTAFVKGGLVM